jgi:hypothetical protein
MNAMNSPKDQDDATHRQSESMKFMIQQAIAEAQLFWQRINTILVVQAASVAGVSTLIAADKPTSTVTAALLSGIGLSSCIVWFQITRMSRYYGDVWLRDARRIADTNPALKELFFYSLGFREQIGKKQDAGASQRMREHFRNFVDQQGRALQHVFTP